MRLIQALAAGWVVLVLCLLAVHVVLPQRSGVLGLTQVLEPYILLTALVACIFAIRERWLAERVIALVFIVVAFARCAPGSFSSPLPEIDEPLQVMTWNIEASPEGAERAVRAVQLSEAGLVALEELQPEAARAVTGDPMITQRLPHRSLYPHETVRGIGLLSAYPIVEAEWGADPPLLRALVAPATADPYAVYVVHPLPVRFGLVAGIPVSLDSSKRDADIALIRRQIDQDLNAGRSVIVMGDLNTTEREPAYADFSTGLRDAHLEAGIGPGLTWRPSRLAGLPFGLLRIDYVFVSPSFSPFSTFVDCGWGSDHCRLEAAIRIGPDFQP